MAFLEGIVSSIIECDRRFVVGMVYAGISDSCGSLYACGYEVLCIP